RVIERVRGAAAGFGPRTARDPVGVTAVPAPWFLGTLGASLPPSAPASVARSGEDEFAFHLPVDADVVAFSDAVLVSGDQPNSAVPPSSGRPVEPEATVVLGEDEPFDVLLS